MKKVVINDLIKEQAIDYANQQAELLGFKVGSDKWKKALELQLGSSYTTMAVGRNPRPATLERRLKLYADIYPVIFGKKGFIETKIAKGDRKKFEEASARIMAAVSNLSSLYASTVLGIFQKRSVGEDGKSIPASTELPKREAKTREAYAQEVRDIVKNWVWIALVENVLYNSISVLFKISESEFKDAFAIAITEGVDNPNQDIQRVMTQAVEEFLRDRAMNRIPIAFGHVDIPSLFRTGKRMKEEPMFNLQESLFSEGQEGEPPKTPPPAKKRTK